tara:strand:- start:2062 stop:2952 length:891 start_codon:yes stop_codon:yes gene_type:complete
LYDDEDTYLGRRRLAFIDYNPFEDKRISPKSLSDRSSLPEIPEPIHDAVRRAKAISGHLEQSLLFEIAGILDTAYRDKTSLIASKSKEFEQSPYDHIPANESDHLEAFLCKSGDMIPGEERALYFCVLTYSLAGEVLNTLYPSDEYIRYTADEIDFLRMHRPDYDPRQITESNRQTALSLTVEALRAVARAEGSHREFVGMKSERRKVSSSGGSNRGKSYEPLKLFILREWKNNYSSHTNSSAAELIAAKFKKHLPSELQPFEDSLKIPANHKARKKRFEEWIGLFKRGELDINID